MIISMIVALTDDGVIGIENRLPWKLPNDMKWFRQQTMGKPIIMGRKTFESFGARPLPGRTNIIITRDPDYRADACVIVHSIEAALDAVRDAGEVMIIGGASFYKQMLPHTDRLYLTLVHAEVDGDAWFPEVDPADWQEVERIDNPADEKNLLPHSFVILERKQPDA